MKQMHKHEAQVQSQSPARRLSVLGLVRFEGYLGRGHVLGLSSYAALNCGLESRVQHGHVCRIVPAVWPRSKRAFVCWLCTELLLETISGDPVRSACTC